MHISNDTCFDDTICMDVTNIVSCIFLRNNVYTGIYLNYNSFVIHTFSLDFTFVWGLTEWTFLTEDCCSSALCCSFGWRLTQTGIMSNLWKIFLLDRFTRPEHNVRLHTLQYGKGQCSLCEKCFLLFSNSHIVAASKKVKKNKCYFLYTIFLSLTC